jgi:hypothetical protein
VLTACQLRVRVSAVRRSVSSEISGERCGAGDIPPTSGERAAGGVGIWRISCRPIGWVCGLGERVRPAGWGRASRGVPLGVLQAILQHDGSMPRSSQCFRIIRWITSRPNYKFWCPGLASVYIQTYINRCGSPRMPARARRPWPPAALISPSPRSSSTARRSNGSTTARTTESCAPSRLAWPTGST